MKSFLRLAVLTATLLGLALVGRLVAQTALTQTTLAAALAAPAQGSPNTLVVLTSGTGVSAGVGLAIDNEYFVVQGANPTTSTTRWTVSRGQSGTSAGAHASGAAVLIGAPNNFAFNSQQPVGPCTSTLEQMLPRVVVSTRISIFNCPAVSTLTGSTAATWDRITNEGYGVSQPARYTGWVYATAGALRIQNGIQYIGSGGALAMTLAAPAVYQSGMVMVLQASTAQAHTVTYTDGFWGGTNTSSDVATFGGAIGDVLVIEAVNGAWRVLAQKNITIA